PLLLFGLAPFTQVDGLDRYGPPDVGVDGVINHTHGASSQLSDNLIAPDSIHPVPSFAWKKAFDGNRPPGTYFRLCRQVFTSVAERITAPPANFEAAGFSPCTSHAITGFIAGSSIRRVVASTAGTCFMAAVSAR